MIIEGDEQLDELATDLDAKARSISRETRGVMARHLDDAAETAQAIAKTNWDSYGRGEAGSAGTIRARMGRVGSRGGSAQEGFLLADGDGAFYQEVGTAHHPPQPALGPAIDTILDPLGADLADSRDRTVSREAVVAAVKDHLVAGGLLAGAAKKPDGGGWQGRPGQSDFVPYAIVWPVGTGDEIRHLSMAGTYNDLRPRILVRVVGATHTQANGLLDDVQDRMLRAALAVPGHHVSNLVPEGTISTDEDPDDVPKVWFAGAYYRVWMNPS